jgi:Cysteine-rich secretory protein family
MANKYELYMIKLINADRAEAGLKPLKINGDLNAASDAHSEWMLAKDVFSHTGSGGSTAMQRMEAAGYDLTGSWAAGENIALQSERGNARYWDDVRDLHKSLMNSPEHRANLMSANYKDIGIGIEVGQFTSNGRTFESVVVTQDFGRTSASTAQSAKADAFEFRDANGGAADTVAWQAPAATRTPVIAAFDAPIESQQDFAVQYNAEWSVLV